MKIAVVGLAASSLAWSPCAGENADPEPPPIEISVPDSIAGRMGLDSILLYPTLFWEHPGKIGKNVMPEILVPPPAQKGKNDAETVAIPRELLIVGKNRYYTFVAYKNASEDSGAMFVAYRNKKVVVTKRFKISKILELKSFIRKKKEGKQKG